MVAKVVMEINAQTLRRKWSATVSINWLARAMVPAAPVNSLCVQA